MAYAAKSGRWRRAVVLPVVVALMTALPAPDMFAQAPKPTPGAAPPAPAAPSPLDDAMAAISAWFERAYREYQTIVTNDLSVPTEKALSAERQAREGKPKPPVAAAPAAAPAPPVGSAATPVETARATDLTDAETRERQRKAAVTREQLANGTATSAPAGPIKSGAASTAGAVGKPEPSSQKTGTPSPKQDSPRPDAPKSEAAKTETGKTAPFQTDAPKPEPSVAAPVKPPASPVAPALETAKPAPPRTLPPAAPSPAALADAANKAGTAALKGLEPPASDRVRVADAKPASGSAASSTAVSEPKWRSKSGKRGRCKAAGEAIDPPGYYVVKPGDNLWSISQRHYDQGARYGKIVKANARRIADPDLIFPCQRFYLPG